MEDMPTEKLKTLEEDHKEIEDANKVLAADIKAASTGMLYPQALNDAGHRNISYPELAKLKATPTDAELLAQLEETVATV